MAIKKPGKLVDIKSPSDNVLVFPETLRLDSYKYRHIKIIAKKSDASFDDAVKFAEAAYDTGSNIVKAVSEQISGTAPGGLDKLQERIEAGNELKKELNKAVKAVMTFILPLPNEFSESTSHEFSTEKGLMGTAYETLGNANVGGMSIDKAMGMAANAAGMRKPIGNPGYWQSYTGTAPREFTFTFDLVPNNIEEATTMISIINLFKIYTLPESTMSGAMVLAPHFFEIQIANPYINDMIKLDEVVCTSVNINYGADGQMQQTGDGVPKYMQLSLSFRDKRMQYATPTGGK